MKIPKFFRNLRISPKSIQEKTKSFSRKLEPSVENLRSKIFSEELSELVKQVTEKKQMFTELKSKPIELFKNIELNLLNNLNKVFNSKNKKLSLSEYLSNELFKHNFTSFILFQFYPLEGLYKPEIYVGVSSETGKRFYFHSTGIYLKKIKNNFINLEFNQTLRGDTFFQKKIDKSDFENFSGIILYKFTESNLNGMLGCFYKDLLITEQFISELENFFYTILKPIYPTIGVFFHEQKEENKTFENYQIYNQIIRYAKSILVRGEAKTLHIYNITIENYFSVENRKEKKEKLIQNLKDCIQNSGYIIENCYQSYYLVLKNSISEKLEEILNSQELQPFQFLIVKSEYPKDSKNFFIHF